MITFIIPVKSAQLSNDWAAFSKLVERTLGSVCQQKDSDFRVQVVCHELPETDFSHPSLQFVQVDFDPPKLVDNDKELNNSLKERDKAMKIKAGIDASESTDYFMVVDSDDLISNRISGFVNKNLNNKKGWYMPKGYFYREGERMAFLNLKTFNTYCGTCLVLHQDIVQDIFVENPLFSYNHKMNPQELGLKAFPFAAALYSMGNGENHVMSNEKMTGLLNRSKRSISHRIRAAVSKLKKYRPQPLSSRFRKQFNFYEV